MGDALKRGIALYESQRYALAIEEFRQELTFHPSDGYAMCLLALALSSDGKHSAAAQTAAGAMSLSPTLAFAHHVVAAMGIRACQISPSQPVRAAFTRRFSRRYRQQMMQARRAEAEAIRLDPQNADYLAIGAGIELELRCPSSALELVQRGLAAQPDHAECLHLRSLLLQKAGRFKDAATTIDQSLAANPESPWAMEQRARLLLQQGRSTEAEQLLVESLRVHPGNIAAQKQLDYLRIQKCTSLRHIYRFIEVLDQRFGRRFVRSVLAVVLGALVLTSFFSSGTAGHVALQILGGLFTVLVVLASAKPRQTRT